MCGFVKHAHCANCRLSCQEILLLLRNQRSLVSTLSIPTRQIRFLDERDGEVRANLACVGRRRNSGWGRGRNGVRPDPSIEAVELIRSSREIRCKHKRDQEVYTIKITYFFRLGSLRSSAVWSTTLGGTTFEGRRRGAKPPPLFRKLRNAIEIAQELSRWRCLFARLPRVAPWANICRHHRAEMAVVTL